MKDIKVKDAYFLPHNFPIETMDDDFEFFADKISSVNSEYSKYSDKGTITTEDTCCDHLPDDIIRVNENSYSDAIMSKLRDIFENRFQKVSKIVKKQSGYWRGMAHVELETASSTSILSSGEEVWNTSSAKMIPTNLDPMPWVEEYEIEL